MVIHQTAECDGSDTKGIPLAEQRAMWKKEAGEDSGDDMNCEHR